MASLEMAAWETIRMSAYNSWVRSCRIIDKGRCHGVVAAVFVKKGLLGRLVLTIMDQARISKGLGKGHSLRDIARRIDQDSVLRQRVLTDIRMSRTARQTELSEVLCRSYAGSFSGTVAA